MPPLFSININKIALIRNSRGKNFPNLLPLCDKLIKFGAQGITIHPRPDERHTRYKDAYELKKHLPKNIELNIEGYPSEKFLTMICEVKPTQCTLVPDASEAITSNAGWDCIANQELLQKVTQRLQKKNIRVSLFINADPTQINVIKAIGSNRIELYTENYADAYGTDKEEKVFKIYEKTAKTANENNLSVNAGHDLNLDNLKKLSSIANLAEVSIGHALIVDMIHYGMEKTLQLYRQELS